MFIDLFRNNAQVSLDGECVVVTFTHWAQRAKGFSFNLQSVCLVEAMQIEPALMKLTFYIEDESWREISENMAGWGQVLIFVQNYFIGFDRDAYECAKGDIGRVCVCWRRSNAVNF